MSVVLANFTKKGNGVPGMSEKIYIALRDQVIFPATVTPIAAPGDRFRLAGDITFKESAHGWVEAYATKDTVQSMLERVGTKDSKQWKASVKFFVPTLDPQYVDLLHDDPDVIIATRRPDCTNAEWYIFGDNCKALEVTGVFDSALSSDDSGKHGFNVDVMGNIPKVYFYPNINEFIAPGWE